MTVDPTRFYEEFWQTGDWCNSNLNHDERYRLRKIDYLMSIALTDRKPTTRPKLVDIGCGRGWLADHLGKTADVLAIDPIESSAKHAKANYPNLQVLCESTESLLTLGYGEHFEIATCSEVIEHIPYAFQQDFLHSINKLLRRNGKFIITTPRLEVLDAYTKYRGRPSQPIEDWLTESQLKQMLAESGFSIQHSTRIFVPGQRISTLKSRLVRNWIMDKHPRLLKLPYISNAAYTSSVYQAHLCTKLK